MLQTIIQILSKYNLEFFENNEQNSLLIKVIKEDLLVQDKILFKNYLNNLLDRTLSFDPILSIFDELYMNICQHAKAVNSFCYVLYSPENKVIKLLFYDEAKKGIAKKIKDFFSDINFKTDSDCIEYSLNEKVTTRTFEYNQGRGLDNLRTIVESMNSELEIFSGNGKYENRKKVISKTNSSEKIKGTIIIVNLNCKNLDLKEESEYTNSLEF